MGDLKKKKLKDADGKETISQRGRAYNDEDVIEMLRSGIKNFYEVQKEKLGNSEACRKESAL